MNKVIFCEPWRKTDRVDHPLLHAMHTLQPSQNLTAAVAAKLKKMLNLSHTKKTWLVFWYCYFFCSFIHFTVISFLQSGCMQAQWKNGSQGKKQSVDGSLENTQRAHCHCHNTHNLREKREQLWDPREAIILFQANQPGSHCFHIPKCTSHSVNHACKNMYKIPIFTGITSFFQCFNFLFFGGLDAIPGKMTK